VLEPGDVVVVPDLLGKQVTCGTAQRHVFRRKGVPTPLRIRLLADGQPRKDLPYRLVVDGRPIRTGTTTDDGMIEGWVDPTAKRAVVVVETEVALEEYEVLLGHLDPVTTEDGVRQRLSNLGYIEDDGPDALESALRSFQLDEHIEPTGDPDGATQERLVSVHGS
jgi:hypothetical protein